MLETDELYKNHKMGHDLYGINLISPFYKKFPTFDPRIKIGILASGNGSNFEYIIKSINSKQLNAEISILIVNNPNCLAIKIAEKYNVPYVLIDHRDCTSRIEHDSLVMNKLNDSADLHRQYCWHLYCGSLPKP